MHDKHIQDSISSGSSTIPEIRRNHGTVNRVHVGISHSLRKSEQLKKISISKIKKKKIF